MNKQDLISALKRKKAQAVNQAQNYKQSGCKNLQNWWEGRESAWHLAIMMAEQLPDQAN